MIIGEPLGDLREQKVLSRGDIEKQCGLLRSYISRVEQCRAITSIDILGRWARTLEVPLYQLFYEGEELPGLAEPAQDHVAEEINSRPLGNETHFLERFRRLLGRTDESNRRLLLYMAQKMANR